MCPTPRRALWSREPTTVRVRPPAHATPLPPGVWTPSARPLVDAATGLACFGCYLLYVVVSFARGPVPGMLATNGRDRSAVAPTLRARRTPRSFFGGVHCRSVHSVVAQAATTAEHAVPAKMGARPSSSEAVAAAPPPAVDPPSGQGVGKKRKEKS